MNNDWKTIDFTGHPEAHLYEGVSLKISPRGEVVRLAYEQKVYPKVRSPYVRPKAEKELKPVRLRDGYIGMRITDKNGKQRNWRLHRLVAITFKVEGYEKWLKNPKAYSVDHIDRDPRNNCVENLRFATHSQQKHNSGVQKDNITGYRGVSEDNRRVGGKRFRWAMEWSPPIVDKNDLEKIAQETNGKLVRGNKRIRYSISYNDSEPPYYTTAEEAAKARDKKVLELVELGYFGTEDTPLNFAA